VKIEELVFGASPQKSILRYFSLPLGRRREKYLRKLYNAGALIRKKKVEGIITSTFLSQE
jgi:hypothetical protein